MKLLAILLALSLGASAWAQRVPVAVTAPESLKAGQTGALTIVVTNTNPMEQVVAVPSKCEVLLTYTDLDQSRSVSAETTINIQRTVGGVPWVLPMVTVSLPPPLTMDVNTVQFSGSAGSTVGDMGGGTYRFSTSSIPAGATWTASATVKNP